MFDNSNCISLYQPLNEAINPSFKLFVSSCIPIFTEVDFSLVSGHFLVLGHLDPNSSQAGTVFVVNILGHWIAY